MAKTLRLMPLLALGASVSACGVVTESADATVLRYRTTVVLGVAAAGLLLIVLGLYLVVRVLPRRLQRYRGRPIRQIRSFFTFTGLPVIGVVVLVVAFPFWQYRVEVRHDALVMDAFPGGHRELREPDIERLEKIEGGTRILIRTSSGEDIFINAGEVGQDAVDRVWDALSRSTLVGNPAD